MKATYLVIKYIRIIEYDDYERSKYSVTYFILVMVVGAMVFRNDGDFSINI